MTELRPDPEVIRATYRWLAHAEHGVSEVRVIRPGKGIVGIGFFDDEEAFVAECVRTNAAGNVYVGIQPRPRRLFDQAPNAIRPLKSGAGRKDIEVVTATVMDLDPVRPKDTASTDDELAAAVEATDAAAAWAEESGVARPARMMSGNGAQLWFAVPPIVVDDHNRDVVQTNLKAFEAEVRGQVESERIKVDSIHDLPRIIKVVGTVSRKGEHTAERPHRVSAALDGLDRSEDPKLRERLLRPLDRPANGPAGTTGPPSFQPAVAPAAGAKVGRTPEGEIDWCSPVEMCGPVQRLWNDGAEDRSLAIFNIVRFFMHKQLRLNEITELVLEYDRRGLGKLRGRDGLAYVRNCYDKIASSVGVDGTIAPPCHSLQGLGYCRVNREPGTRCELYDFVFDIEKAIEAIPEDSPVQDLEYRLRPVLEAIAQRDPSMHGRYLGLLEKRFKLKARDLRRSLSRAGRRGREDDEEASAADVAPAPAAEAIDGEIYEDTCFYYTQSPRGETKAVSSFTIEPTMRVEVESSEIICGRASTDKGTTVDDLRLPLQAFHSKRDLIRHLQCADLQWTGSDNNVQGLLRVLARRPVPKRPGTTMLGDCRREDLHLWVCPDGAISKDGFMDPSPVVYIKSGGSLDARLRYRPCDDDTFGGVARTVFEHLPQLNLPGIIVPIIGWWFASPMKPRFMERVGSFPVLFIWGGPGSGKSTMATDVFWPLFGIKDSEPYSATETEFALLKILSASSSVPVFIDEYKPYDMQRYRLNTLHRYMRRIYRGEVEERGKPDQSVNTYHLQVPLCIAGETRPIEAALLERFLTANPEKATLDKHPQCRQALRELKAVPLSAFAPRYIQFCLGRDFDADMEVAEGAVNAVVARRKVPLRIVENLTAMLLGVHLFEQFAQACGYQDLQEDLGVKTAVKAVLEDVLETDYGVKNALDHFVEMLGVMAIQGELRHGTHYVLKGEILNIHLESCYDSFRQHCKRIDYEGELVDIKALRRLIRENHLQNGYVVHEGERVYFGTNANRRRAIGIDLEKTDLVSEDNFRTDEADDSRPGRVADWTKRYGD